MTRLTKYLFLFLLCFVPRVKSNDESIALFEVMTLLSHDDVLRYIYTITSLTLLSRQEFFITIVDDGSLRDIDCLFLRYRVRGIRIIRKKTADAVVKRRFANLPYCRMYRASHATVRKHLDLPLLAKKEKILMLDSDILFVRTPARLLSYVNDPAFTGVVYMQNDCDAYVISQIEAKALFGKPMTPRINSGLITFPTSIINLKIAEILLRYVHKNTMHRYLFMQTYYAILSSLSPTYAISLPEAQYVMSVKKSNPRSMVCRHYIKIPYWIRNQFFVDVWRLFLPNISKR